MKQTTPEATAEQPTRQRPARRGTGPRTKRGKRISSKNALKYGFLSKEVVLQSKLWSESASEFKQLLESYVDYFKPVGRVEMDQLEIAVAAIWRYRRLLKAERRMVLEVQERTHSAFRIDECWPKENEPGSRHERSVASLSPAQPDCADVIRYESGLPKVQRYEAHLLRIYYRALNQLERFQRMRLGNAGPAPLVVDVQS